MRTRITRTAGVVALSVGIVATSSVGVTLAATKSTSVKACATSTHVLKLLTASGKCPKHSSTVTLGAAGPRGATGEQGIQGVQGIQGKPGDPGKDLTAPAGVVVVPGASDQITNGKALVTAIDALDGSTATTIELGPGEFNLGGNGLPFLPEDVRLLGAGIDQTTIIGAPPNGTLLQASESTSIDDLTLENNSTASDRTAVSVPGGASVRIDQVVISAGTDTTAGSTTIGLGVSGGQAQVFDSEIDADAVSSGSSTAIGFQIASEGVVTVNDVHEFMNADGAGDSAYGAFVTSGSGIFVGLTTSIERTDNAAGIGVQSDDQTTVRDSSIDTGTGGTALDLSGASASLFVADSMIRGTATGATCVGDFTISYVALNTVCH